MRFILSKIRLHLEIKPVNQQIRKNPNRIIRPPERQGHLKAELTSIYMYIPFFKVHRLYNPEIIINTHGGHQHRKDHQPNIYR